MPTIGLAFNFQNKSLKNQYNSRLYHKNDKIFTNLRKPFLHILYFYAAQGFLSAQCEKTYSGWLMPDHLSEESKVQTRVV